MFNNNTDKDWESFGKDDPYFGVLSHDKYRSSSLTEEGKAEFFKSGSDYIEYILKVVRAHIAPDVRVNRALDFGCGVGRLVVPLANVAQEVVGIDVSESMLEEARRNCEQRSLHNATFVSSDDTLSRLVGQFDFIHSFIVFQHIPVERGEYIFSQLIEHLSAGGIGVVQFTYAKGYETDKFIPWIKKYIPLASNLINWVKGRGFNYYEMQMNTYDVNRLLLILQRVGVRDVYTEFTNSGDELGLTLYFRKPDTTGTHASG